MIKAAEAMVQCLAHEGIKVVFGYPGAAICPFYDALYESDIHHVLVRHEANAGHAASGYARITNKPAVCIATSGPGATNLLTAIATAYADSIPLVCITGQVSTDQIGGDVFQEADITGAAEPFVKHSYLVKDAAALPRIFKEAFYLAGTGRKGPVLIDVPVDIQNTMIDFSYPETVQMRTYKPTIKGNPIQIRKICEMLRSAKRPLICAGGGVFLSGAQEELLAFAEKTNIPVVSTMMGLGILPSAHPLYLGMLGMHGTAAANTAVHDCDVMLLVGARVGDRAVRSPKFLAESTTIIHMDIDPAEIGKNINTDIPLVGDCEAILTEMAGIMDEVPASGWHLPLAQKRAEDTAIYTPHEDGSINPKAFLRELSAKLPENTVCVADVGQNQIWSCNHFGIRKQGRFLTTGGMGTMGYSVPCGIGAKMAAPDREVVVICGDGSFQMQMMELSTMMQEGITVKIVIFANTRLGMVREIQTMRYGDRQMAVHLNGSPDFAALARAYGIEAENAYTAQEAAAMMEQLIASDKPYLLVCHVDALESTLS
ncbi:MAG: biosynthetic-type acetolactate synthase large subunit [Ruminococcus sp.]|nr:biosynthetic-type acetolactate synthase large subunit [Ruminococcus sp.]